jgi:hypothetical protein
MLLKDKLYALKWSEKYRADYDRYQEYRQKHGVRDYFVSDGGPSINAFHVSGEGKKLCRKYGLPYPFSPYEDDLPDDIRSLLNISSAAIAYKIPGTSADVIVNGDRLQFMVEVDTTQSETVIGKEFIRLYRRMRSLASRPERIGRDTFTRLDHWKIYSLYRNGNFKAQIMKEEFGITTTPSYDENADKHYQQVKRAIEKAERLIKEFEKLSNATSS